MAIDLFSNSSPSKLLTLHAGELAIELAPHIGGAIARFYSVRHGRHHHWLRPASDAALTAGVVDGMASFPLVPFCNRLRNGTTLFNGDRIDIAPNRPGSPHPIHGIGWQRPWRVTAHDSESAQLEMAHAGEGWPFPFHASQLITLRDDRLSVTLEVENRGSQSMPLGIGHHPYLPHRQRARLGAALEAMWATDDELLPTTLVSSPLLGHLRNGVGLEGLVVDNNFTGWDRVARIDWRADGEHEPARRLLLSAESPCDFLVVYAPADEDYFCVEPVSNCTDWLNLGSHPPRHVGGSVLAPGTSARATFWLEPGWPEHGATVA